MQLTPSRPNGFTLIELSIVLVIIGLIVGGVLVGRDLIAAAGVRATLTQIEKINQASNTFRVKYGSLPGDIPANDVARFGFTVVNSRAGTQGRGDGNGLLEGICFGGAVNSWTQGGETFFFWEDLSANTGLIEGNFSTALDGTNTNQPNYVTQLPLYYPSAKIGRGNYFSVMSWNSANYISLSVPSGTQNCGTMFATSGLTVAEAYKIDQKVDDGFPQSGNVQAMFASNFNGYVWAAGGSNLGAGFYNGSQILPSTSATPGTTSTCYDNNNANGANMAYSITQNSGQGLNCALSFRMQ
jgi:prepilin-type N-terminal cleavage/methylation domain-containing protein